MCLPFALNFAKTQLKLMKKFKLNFSILIFVNSKTQNEEELKENSNISLTSITGRKITVK